MVNILQSEVTEDKRTPVRVRNVFAVFDFDALGWANVGLLELSVSIEQRILKLFEQQVHVYTNCTEELNLELQFLRMSKRDVKKWK